MKKLPRYEARTGGGGNNYSMKREEDGPFCSAWDVEKLEDALKLVLMFHKGGIWSAENVIEWRRITGSEEGTTKVMCDHIRKVLG